MEDDSLSVLLIHHCVYCSFVDLLLDVFTSTCMQVMCDISVYLIVQSETFSSTMLVATCSVY